MSCRRRASWRRALRGVEADLILAGADTSDGGAGVVPAGVAALLGLPYLSYAAKIEPDPDAGTVRVHRISPTGFDVLEAPMPAFIACTQALGAPRYPSLKGIMAARSKQVEEIALDPVGERRAAMPRPRPRSSAPRRRRRAPRRGSSARRRTRPPARSSRSSPSGGSSDGRRHLGPRRDERRREPRQHQRRGRDARARAGGSLRARARRCRGRSRSGRRRRRSSLATSRGSSPRRTRRLRDHAAATIVGRAARGRDRMRGSRRTSSPARVPRAATSPAWCRR